MNVIRSRFKYISISAKSFLQIAKDYSTQRPLPINWIRPEKVSCILPEKSGDGGIELNIKDSDPMKHFDKSKELETADDFVKKMFSVGFNRRKDLVTVKRVKTLELVQRHKQDIGSMEAKIAAMTAEILQLQEHQQNFSDNKKSKVFLKELIEKRKKILKKLRNQDYPRFEFLLERLNLVYKPFPRENPRIAEKDSTRRLLNKYCDKLVKEKLDAYKAELQAQQKDFFKEKAEKLEFIRNEEIACGVTPTITEEEIEAAKKKAESFVN